MARRGRIKNNVFVLGVFGTAYKPGNFFGYGGFERPRRESRKLDLPLHALQQFWGQKLRYMNFDAL